MDSPQGSPDSSLNRDDTPTIPGPSRLYAVSTRHPDFWFYDGSIVLSVESCLFRVHQTVLANHSDIFADLFTVPQPGEEGEQMMDGCRVVHLSNDDEKDFVDLLHAIYQPDYFDSLSADADLKTLLSFIQGILRLSTKYLIRYLRQRSISLLLTKFPSTLEDYTSKAASSYKDRYKSDSVMHAIKLAQENSVFEILPYAFYCIARISHKRILQDRQTDISWKDKALTLVGRERLQWAQTSLSHGFLLNFQRAPICQSPLCAVARGPHAEWHTLDNMKSPNPLRTYDTWDNLNVCSDCVAYCKIRHSKGRQEVWDRLPDLFELPTWDELRKTQNM